MAPHFQGTTMRWRERRGGASMGLRSFARASPSISIWRWGGVGRGADGMVEAGAATRYSRHLEVDDGDTRPPSVSDWERGKGERGHELGWAQCWSAQRWRKEEGKGVGCCRLKWIEGEKVPMRLFSISNSFPFSQICYALFEMVFEFKFEHATMQGVPPYVQQTSKYSRNFTHIVLFLSGPICAK